MLTTAFYYHFVSCINVIPSHHINSNFSQATGPKAEVFTEQSAKRLKTSMASDVVKLASPQSSDADIGMSSPHAETTVDKQLVKTASQSPKANTPMRLQEPTGLRQSIQPLVPVNRYKLDNRPTAFRIIPPLPVGLANVSLLSLPHVSVHIVEFCNGSRCLFCYNRFTKDFSVRVGHELTCENSRR